MIIYKSTNKPNQSIFLKIYPSTNTRYGPTASITTLAIVPPTSTYITQYDLNNNVKYIHTDIKSFNKKIHTDIKALTTTSPLWLQHLLIKMTSKTSKNRKPQIFHQDPLKIKRLLSLLNIHLLRITFRANSKLRFLQLIKVLKNKKNNW